MDEREPQPAPRQQSDGWRGAPEHPRETERLAALRETGLVGVLPAEIRNSVARLAAEIFSTPISAVSLVDADRQWFAGAVGLPCHETDREVAFCAHTILSDEPLIVEDATKDERFAWNPLVTGELGIRFYAGVPLKVDNGLPLGTLCVIDTVPKRISVSQLAALRTLGELVSSQLQLHQRNHQLSTHEVAQKEILGRLTKIASRVPGLIYQYRLRPDGSSCFPYASDGIRQIYRVTPEQVREDAGDVFAILHPDDLDSISESIDRSARTLNPWKCEYRVRFPDGVERWLMGDATPEREPDGGTLWHGFITDITARKQSEGAMARLNTELIEARRLAEASSRAKSAFLANMSHEIRTPLTAILGYAELLSDDDMSMSPDDRAKTIGTIRSAGQHLQTVISDILDLSKVEAERMTIENVETPLPALLSEVRSLLVSGAEGKGLTFDARLDTPVPERIMSDPTRLRQILLNLLGNAIKFTESGRVILSVGVESDDSGASLRIDVEDTGPGMHREQADRLFAVFGQGDGSVARRYGGTGLGLTICRRLARLMGGDVTLERTAPGEGSCFRLCLPLEAAGGTAMVRDMALDPSTPGANQGEARLSGRVLLAEDGPDNQRIITYHLERAGATVDIADNGQIALQMIDESQARGTPYDLLLTDIQMPEMDGHTLARTLRANGSRLPIVALTAYAMDDDREDCIRAGCDDYATKPIDRHAFLATCAHWMGRAGGESTPEQAA